jgi:hypothetical protein
MSEVYQHEGTEVPYHNPETLKIAEERAAEGDKPEEVPEEAKQDRKGKR